MGRVVLQEYVLPSQHAYRSMRRRNARETKDREMMNMKCEVAQLKYERDALQNEVLSWRAWYDALDTNCSNVEPFRESAEKDTGMKQYELPTKVATDLQEVNSGIDVSLQELTNFRSSALDESTDVGSLASGPGNESYSSSIHLSEVAVRQSSTSCMGRGRGSIRSRRTEPATDQEEIGNKPAKRSCKTGRKPAWVTRARVELETELESKLRSSFRELLESVT